MGNFWNYREKLGKCITFVKLIKNVTECDALYEHTFGKVDVGDNSTFLTSGIGESSYVVVSTNQRPAVASGIVSSINPKSISVILDRYVAVTILNCQRSPN